jgi:hypothetical protein
MLKLSENPPIRTPGVDCVSGLDQPWWVAHTRTRQEKALAWDLCRRGVGYFLPMVERETFSGGRRRQNLYPLFTSYLFFNGDGHVRRDVLATNRVANVLPVRARDEFVEEIAALEQALLTGASLQLHPRLTHGTRCRVVKGPMRGVEGTILEDADATRLVLHVSLLGQGASLEISADFLEPTD